MGFKLPGKSMTSGTSAHSSALKMREAEVASAFKMKMEREASAFKQLTDLDKQKANMDATKKARLNKSKDSGKKMADADWKKGQEKAKAAGGDLDALVKKRKGLEKGSDDWKRNQNKINEALGSKKRYDVGEAEPTKKEKVITKGDLKKEKISAKSIKKTAEVTENVDKRVAKLTRKEAKKKYGRGSKEHLQAKKDHLAAKEADRQGSKGGKKQTFFRRLSSKINKKKQEKTQAKIDAMD